MGHTSELGLYDPTAIHYLLGTAPQGYSLACLPCRRAQARSLPLPEKALRQCLHCLQKGALIMCGNGVERAMLRDGARAASAMPGQCPSARSGKVSCKHFGCLVPSCGMVHISCFSTQGEALAVRASAWLLKDPMPVQAASKEFSLLSASELVVLGGIPL